MINVIKSIALWASIISILSVSAFLIFKTIKNRKKIAIIDIILRTICSIALACTIIPLLPYSNPFNTHLDFEYVTTVEDVTIFPRSDWYVNYDFIDSNGTGYFTSSYPTKVFPDNEYTPKEDLTKYTYVYSFGYQIEDIYYNVWDVYGIPILDLGKDPKLAKVVFKDIPKTRDIYVYRLPAIAIENEAVSGKEPPEYHIHDNDNIE